MTINTDKLLKNWKTTLTGAVTFVMAVPSVIDALHAWAAHKDVDWRHLLVSIAIAAAGTGLVAAKDSSTNATIAEVQASTAKAEVAKDSEADKPKAP